MENSRYKIFFIENECTEDVVCTLSETNFQTSTPFTFCIESDLKLPVCPSAALANGFSMEERVFEKMQNLIQAGMKAKNQRKKK